MIDLDYCVRFIDLPLTTKGVTVEDANGFFNIYINENLSVEQQQAALGCDCYFGVQIFLHTGI